MRARSRNVRHIGAVHSLDHKVIPIRPGGTSDWKA
jgi:hypothetical protein